VEYLSATVAGLGAGSLYAVIGVLLVLMATLTRVINFALVAVGVYAAFLSIRLAPLLAPLDLPKVAVTIISVIFALIVGALVSALLGWIIATWLPESSDTSRSAVTVAAMLGLISLSLIQFGPLSQPLIPLAIGPLVSFGIVTITQVAFYLLILAILILIVSRLILTKTPIGVQLRAIADRQTAAELLGINVKVLQIGVWAVSGALMTLAILIGGNNLAPQATIPVNLIIPGAAAALFGAFKRADLAVVGGLVLGGIQGLITAWPDINILRDWIPIFTIVIILLWNQRKEVWDVAR
jgi:branched-chain amino acid transport system permease protein